MTIDRLEDLAETAARLRRDVVLEVQLEDLRRGEFAVLVPSGDVHHRGPCGHLFNVSAQRQGHKRDGHRYSAGVSNLDLVTVHPEMVCPTCRAEWIVVGGRIVTDPRFRGMLRRRADW